MSKEFYIPIEPEDTPQNYTPKVEAEFAKRDLDIHRHEVEHLEDDFKKGLRVLRVKNRKYFFMGG